MAKKKDAPPPPPPKRKPEEPPVEEGLPIWMATFADMVTLLLCFFVLLLSFAEQDLSKFRTLMGSIKDAFGVQVRREQAEFAAFSPSQFERKDVEMDRQDKAILGMVLQLKSMTLEDEVLKETAKITSQDRGVVMRVPNNVLFEPDTAKLKPDADKVLQKVISILKEHNVHMVVRGHTDDRFEGSQMYPSNWELSSSRAAATLRKVLNISDLRPSRMKAVGYADTQPLVPNNSDQNRQVNERMEFYFHTPSDKSW